MRDVRSAMRKQRNLISESSLQNQYQLLIHQRRIELLKYVEITQELLKSYSLVHLFIHSLQELDEEKQCRIRAQKSEAQVLLQYQLAKTECERMKSELRKLREQ